MRSWPSEGFKQQKLTSSENRCSALKKKKRLTDRTRFYWNVERQKAIAIQHHTTLQFVVSSLIIANKTRQGGGKKETPHVRVLYNKKTSCFNQMYHHNKCNKSTFALLSKPINLFLYFCSKSKWASHAYLFWKSAKISNNPTMNLMLMITRGMTVKFIKLMSFDSTAYNLIPTPSPSSVRSGVTWWP